MRKAKEIQLDLDKAKRELLSEEDNLKSLKKEYACKGDEEDWYGLRVFIYLAISATLCFLWSLFAYIPVMNWMRYVIFLLTPILALIASIRFAAGKIGYRANKFILITGILLLVIDAVLFVLLWFIPIEMIPVDNPSDFAAISFLTVAYYPIPLIILIIASSVKNSRLNKKRDKLLTDISKSELRVKNARAVYEPFSQEMLRNQATAQKLFEEQLKLKDALSEEKIHEAAEYGCGDAGIWLALRYANAAHSKLATLTSEKRNYYYSKISDGLYLSDGCKEKNLKTALYYWIKSCIHEIDPSDYFTEWKQIRYLQKQCDEINALRNDKNKNVCIYANEAYLKYKEAADRAEHIYNVGMSSFENRQKSSGNSSYEIEIVPYVDISDM